MPPKRLLGDSKGSQRDALESTKSHTVDMGRGEQDLGPDLELLLVEANEVRTTLTAKSQALQKKLYTLFSNRKTTELRDAQGKLQAEGQEARYVPCTNLVVSTNLVISIGEEFKRFGEEFKRFGEEFKRFGYEFKRFGEDDAHDGCSELVRGTHPARPRHRLVVLGRQRHAVADALLELLLLLRLLHPRPVSRHTRSAARNQAGAKAARVQPATLRSTPSLAL